MTRAARFAIVGANGFLGRALLEAASRRGGARALVRSEAARASVAGAGFDVVNTGGLGDAERLADALRGCDAVVHTGGVTAGVAGEERTAARGIVNLSAACRAAGTRTLAFVSGLGVHHYGLKPRCTNPYFLAKLCGEVELLRSGLRVVLARPSYVFGPGEGFLTPLLRALVASDELEIAGDGSYRLQPIDVRDAADALLEACQSDRATPVLDLVGPEIVTYRELVARAVRRLEAAGVRALRPALRVEERPIPEADARSRAEGFNGLRPHDLDVLLCDEVSDPGAAAGLIDRPLAGLDAMIDRVAGSIGL
jgi:NADH dehydrogenase